MKKTIALCCLLLLNGNMARPLSSQTPFVIGSVLATGLGIGSIVATWNMLQLQKQLRQTPLAKQEAANLRKKIKRNKTIATVLGSLAGGALIAGGLGTSIKALSKQQPEEASEPAPIDNPLIADRLERFVRAVQEKNPQRAKEFGQYTQHHMKNPLFRRQVNEISASVALLDDRTLYDDLVRRGMLPVNADFAAYEGHVARPRMRFIKNQEVLRAILENPSFSQAFKQDLFEQRLLEQTQNNNCDGILHLRQNGILPTPAIIAEAATMPVLASLVTGLEENQKQTLLNAAFRELDKKFSRDDFGHERLHQLYEAGLIMQDLNVIPTRGGLSGRALEIALEKELSLFQSTEAKQEHLLTMPVIIKHEDSTQIPYESALSVYAKRLACKPLEDDIRGNMQFYLLQKLALLDDKTMFAELELLLRGIVGQAADLLLPRALKNLRKEIVGRLIDDYSDRLDTLDGRRLIETLKIADRTYPSYFASKPLSAFIAKKARHLAGYFR